MHYLGIDYGSKRIGLSFADGLAVAYPLPPATHKTLEERLLFIKAIIQERKIEMIVVGYPYHLNGQLGSRTRAVDAFIECLQGLFGLPIAKADERFTTTKVEQDLRATKRAPSTLSSLRRYRNSGLVDSRAATVILQDYLNEQENPTFNRL